MKQKIGNKDIVLCAVSSVIPPHMSESEVFLQMTPRNGLRKESILKVDRIVTAKRNDVITTIGSLDPPDLEVFIKRFRNLIDQ